ncbi:MAG TPA: hypothetical protein VGR30_06950 [Candidatus Binatia bacterium]|jgi:hypothetical protein|nr:hypothetical protein [Candidatus Binatia bacterium]
MTFVWPIFRVHPYRSSARAPKKYQSCSHHQHKIVPPLPSFGQLRA